MSENKGCTGVLASYASFKHQLKYCFTCVPLCDKYYMYLWSPSCSRPSYEAVQYEHSFITYKWTLGQLTGMEKKWAI